MNTVQSRYNEPASNGNPPITEAILRTIEMFVVKFYIGNTRNLPITDKSGWSLEIHLSGS